jgi:hypothetical protein
VRVVASESLVLVVPLVVMIGLVGLALYSRSAPADSRNRALRAKPRPRRHVAPWVLSALRPFFVYNHNRDAYILRAVGKRIGPVLRSRGDVPPRTKRFDREAPAESETGERVSANS